MAQSASLRPVVAVTALVDWNSQIYAADPPRGIGEIDRARRTLGYVKRTVARNLVDIDGNVNFDVTLRCYSGWHRGFNVTARRKALVSVGAEEGASTTRPSVQIRPEIEFGDRLISAAHARIHPKLNAHLTDTLRPTLYDPTILGEKMVDTAIAADLVDIAHGDLERWIVLLGEDDDLVPPLMVADGVRAGRGGKVIMLRNRTETPFLRFSDLRQKP